MTKEVTTPYCVSSWKSIQILWNEIKVNTIVKVADGVKTLFSKDDWLEAGNVETFVLDIYNSVYINRAQEQNCRHLKGGILC